jgi:hypothetical protein
LKMQERMGNAWVLVSRITKGALDTRWCHYQTLAPAQKGEKPAPEVLTEKRAEKDPLNSAFLAGVLPTPSAARCTSQ